MKFTYTTKDLTGSQLRKLSFNLIKLLNLALLFAAFSAHSQRDPKFALIPQPASVVRTTGAFTVPATLPVVTEQNKDLVQIAQQLVRQIPSITGSKVQTLGKLKTPPARSIFLHLSNNLSIPKEGYILKVSASGINLNASTPAGIFYGVQTLLQLFPPEVESKSPVKLSSWSIPFVTIQDQPRFAWRGLMLDVSRHFFTKQEVMDFIDMMAKYKFNLLHWHLSDDQGWRVEIKSLPKLTEVGAWRVTREGPFGSSTPPQPGEKADYGGFYSQDDIREVVKYAKSKFIDILPEIDMPGHSLAAIASYPDLTSTPGNYYVSPGDRFMVWPAGGHFYGLLDNTLSPAKESTYDFIDNVFTEIAQLFPFEYIHMGGDETARNFWEKSDTIKWLMKKENLKNLDEVQSYFVKRVEKIVMSKGKKLIGWDEILDGGLAPNAAVMSWRGMNGGIEAAKQGHEVVMSPTTFVYLDYMQGDAIIEPPVYATLRLSKTYQFEPVPDGVDPKFIKGGQGNIWTEQMANTRHLQYMVWPRAFAVAEALWSPKDKRDWNSFVPRVERHFQRLEAADVKYSPSMYDPIFEVAKDTTQTVVTMSTEIDGLQIHYSYDNSFPDQYYPVYTSPLTIPKDVTNLKVITSRDNKPIGRMIVMPVAELKKRAARK
jgi:hexosaminidase